MGCMSWWMPTQHYWICSAHFLTGEKSNNLLSPESDYVHSIFAHTKSYLKRDLVKGEKSEVYYWQDAPSNSSNALHVLQDTDWWLIIPDISFTPLITSHLHHPNSCPLYKPLIKTNHHFFHILFESIPEDYNLQNA